MKNLDIFICAHKLFEKQVFNESYKILSVGKNTELYGNDIIRDDDGINCSEINNFYSELSGYYWIWKNYSIKDYIGFCQYRRYFDFMDNIPNVDEIFKEYDIILPSKENFGCSIYNQYKQCHNIDDLNEIMDIVKNKDISVDVLLSDNSMYCFNMFIMKKELFYEYCDFVFGICQEYLRRHNIQNMEDIKNMMDENKGKYYKGSYPSNDFRYQCRIGGFLAERLLNIWIRHKKLKVKEYNVITTENKYKEKKANDFI